jgi:hypothetical protein
LSRFARSRCTVTRQPAGGGRGAGARGPGAVPAGRVCLALALIAAMRQRGPTSAPSVYLVRYPLVSPAGILPRRCPVAGIWAHCKITARAETGL